MQFNKLPIPLTSMALALATAFSLPRPSLADEITVEFECGTHNGLPATIVRSNKAKPFPLIHWVHKLGDYSPQKRCETISQRFQDLNTEGVLDDYYLNIGEVNRSPVLCLTRSRDGSCTQNNVLVTLYETYDAETVKKDLLALTIGVGSKESKLYLSPEGYQIDLQVQNDGSESVSIQHLIDVRTRQFSIFNQNQ